MNAASYDAVVVGSGIPGRNAAMCVLQDSGVSMA